MTARNCRPGQTMTGPAIIEQFDSTTVLHPGDRLTVDPSAQPHHQGRIMKAKKL